MAEPRVVLSAANVSVSYRIGSRKFGSFKEFVLSRLRGESNDLREFHALSDVSIDIGAGHCVGLIGHNGSGKSTLLKVLAGILRARDGRINVNGRMTSLIELGVGFDSELQARDNIYLGCSLMGFSRAEIDAHFDQILDFAQLRDFMDFPLKNYSSGMYARLGFACATAFNPDILLVDEVLAVGDEAFQARCHKRINELKSKGSGIVLVTHDMGAVQQFCDSVCVLDHGKLVYQGTPQEGIARYRSLIGVQ